MRKRPWSSVTTILAYLVGRSLVSAITHTPASGPLAPVTVPAMSLAPAEPSPCGALMQAATIAATAAAQAAAQIERVLFMLSPGLIGAPRGRRDEYSPSGGAAPASVERLQLDDRRAVVAADPEGHRCR